MKLTRSESDRFLKIQTLESTIITALRKLGRWWWGHFEWRYFFSEIIYIRVKSGSDARVSGYLQKVRMKKGGAIFRPQKERTRMENRASFRQKNTWICFFTILKGQVFQWRHSRLAFCSFFSMQRQVPGNLDQWKIDDILRQAKVRELHQGSPSLVCRVSFQKFQWKRGSLKR